MQAQFESGTSMFHKIFSLYIHKFSSIIALTTAFVFFKIEAADIRYQLISFNNNEITVGFTIGGKLSEQDYFFAYPEPSGFHSDVSITAVINESHLSIPVKKRSITQSSLKRLQWCSFELARPEFCSQPHGTIVIHYSDPLLRGLRKEDLSIKNGVISAPVSLPLSKIQEKITSIPFTVGVRIEVSEDGIYSISQAQLVSLGIPVDKIQSKTFRLIHKNVEVPLFISNSQRNYLASDDFLLFYGRQLYGTSSKYEQFSNTNVYWLTWGTTVGSRVAEISGERRQNLSDYRNYSLIKALDFSDTVHFEVDTDIRYLGNVEDDPPEEISDPPYADTSLDNWYWGFIGEEELTTYKISLPSPAASGLARLQISFTGLSSLNHISNDHQIRVLLNNNPAGNRNTAVWDGQRSYLFISDTFPISSIKGGENEISFLCPSRGYPDRSALNWIKIEYTRNYQAINNSIKFKNSSEGISRQVEYQLTGFNTDQLELWDIERNISFTKFTVTRGSGSSRNLYTLSFQDSVNNNTTYIAQAKHMRRTPSLMVLDTIKEDWNKLVGCQHIIISADTFRTDLEPLIQFHNNRGLKSAFVNIDDIYNCFSSGIRDPESIRAFLRYMFLISGANPPRYVLLGGDASHDMDKKNRNRNIVPTHLSRIPGWGPAADDGYFATVCGEDNFPDLSVGRFPAQDREQMRVMVKKTIRYMEMPQPGYWRDNMLLLGGGEAGFSRFNDEAINDAIGQKMYVTRIDADSGSPFYKDGSAASKIIADKINSGVLLVNFNGHGGGNIWSDNNFFGYRDLSKLYNGQWGNGGRLPMVFSFTCLTGFFESVFYRSLGEEFLRTDQNGCIGFYGASAYTSMNGNILMNKLALETALQGESETIGEIIDFCEMSMLVRYGSQYLPLIRQYNLLGDPALTWKLTPDTLRMSLDATSLRDGDSLKFHCKTTPVINGNLKILVSSGKDEWYQSIETIKKGSFSAAYPIKKNIGSAYGSVRAYAWNDSSEIRGWINFSKDTVLVSDVQLTPANPFFGDSVYISCKLSIDSSLLPADVYCRYALGTTMRDNLLFSGIRLISTDNNRWITAGKIPLTYKDNISERLLLYFRINTPAKSKESELFNFKINGRPDLVFTNDSIRIDWFKDSLRINASVLNTGNAAAPPFKMHFFWNTNTEIKDTIHILSIPDSLSPGKSRSFSFFLPDTQGELFFSGWINYHDDFLEINQYNNMVNGYTSIKNKYLLTTKDTLMPGCGRAALVPLHSFKNKKLVFVFANPITQVTPLKTGSRWAPLCGKTNQFKVYSRPALGTADTLLWILRPDTSFQKSSSNRFAIMLYDTCIGYWKYAGGNQVSSSTIHFKSNSTGPLAFAALNDLQVPEIQVAVAGRTLNFTDYAAKYKPFSIFISDPSGIDPQSVKLLLNGKALNKENYSTINESKDFNNLSITAYPTPKHKIDSLQIAAMDLAGNNAVKTVTYLPGEDLSVKFLACHPNPFTARQMPNGQIRNVRFAFLLTDVAESISLTIYTVSGKPIRSWSLSSLIGYQEIRWDGRDKDGFRIANGTYYAKLVAKNKQKKVTKIIRIAKLEGY